MRKHCFLRSHKTDAEKIEAAEAAMRSARAAASSSRGAAGLGRGPGLLGDGRGVFAHRPPGSDPFFVDSAPDWNNIALGSLYRADIARYRREGSAVPSFLAAARRAGRWSAFWKALHEDFDGAPPRAAAAGDFAAGRFYGAAAVQRERSRTVRRRAPGGRLPAPCVAPAFAVGPWEKKRTPVSLTLLP